jgi:hypothetical protein
VVAPTAFTALSGCAAVLVAVLVKTQLSMVTLVAAEAMLTAGPVSFSVQLKWHPRRAVPVDIAQRASAAPLVLPVNRML